MKKPDSTISKERPFAEDADAQAFGEPELLIDAVLKDVEGLLNQKYPMLLKRKELFNISRLHFLLGGQFRVARMAREEGFLLQDCEMCVHYDKALSYCQYYRRLFTKKEEAYYYGGLCPALKTDE